MAAPAGIVVIVDDYAPSRRLAPHFRDAGYACVRVQSTEATPRIYRSPIRHGDYLTHIVHRGSVAATIDALAQFQPVAIVSGSEIGVELVDALGEGLGVAGNGTALSAARRDKYLMIEMIRGAGLRAAEQIRVGSEEELRDWHERIGGRLVIKPERSAAGDGVRFCDRPDESIAAYRTVLGQTNIFSERNRSVVAQEYLFGTEYIVNTVSSEGRHHVCDIWYTARADINGELDALVGISIVPREGGVQDQLAAYAVQALDALGIRFGPAHIEIKMTPAGPCLVELGARMGGSDNPHYAELATGESQLNWTVDAYVHPERFAARHQEHYRIQQHFASIVMLSPRAGVLRSYPLLNKVERLESLHDIRIMIHPGEQIPLSVGGSQFPMIVNLRHPVDGIVARDMETLRYLDGLDFYEIA